MHEYTQPVTTVCRQIWTTTTTMQSIANYGSDAGKEQLLSGQQTILLLKHTMQE